VLVWNALQPKLTSVMEGMKIPSARRTNAIVGCSRKSTAPTSTVVASAPEGILFRMLSLAAFFKSSVEDVYVSSSFVST